MLYVITSCNAPANISFSDPLLMFNNNNNNKNVFVDLDSVDSASQICIILSHRNHWLYTFKFFMDLDADWSDITL